MARDKNFCEVDTLNKLTEVFWQKGYNGTSMDDLLQQSNLSRSSLYSTYGDKRNLFLRALKTYAEQRCHFFGDVTNAKTATEAVNILFNTVINNKKNNCDESKGCFMVNAIVEWNTSDKEINEIFQSNKTFIIKALAKLIKQDINNKFISAHHSSASLATFIYNNYLGMLVALKEGVTVKELSDTKKIVLEMLGK